MAFTLPRRKHGWNLFPGLRRGDVLLLHVNSSTSNYLNTCNSDTFIGNSKIPCINVNTKRSLN